MIFPVICQTLVKFTVFFLCDVIWVPCPDWLSLIQFFIFSILFFNGFLLFIFLFIVFINILNFGLFITFTFFLNFFFGLILFFFFTFNFLFTFLFNNKFNWIANELRMFFNDFFDFTFLEIYKYKIVNNLDQKY